MKSQVMGFGIATLAFVVAINVFVPPGLSTLLSWVLAGMTLRFVSLPGTVEMPNRRTGSLLLVPLVLGFLLLFLGEWSAGKAPGNDELKSCSTILLSIWVVLKAWDSVRNRQLDLQEAQELASQEAIAIQSTIS